MELSNEGLTLWFDTSDAPLTAQSMTIGVRPAHPANAVVVQYRRNRGFAYSLRATPIAAPSGQITQYFRAPLPETAEESVREVLPVMTCSGRQTPSAMQVGAASPLWHRCPEPPLSPRTATADRTARNAGSPRFPYQLDLLGAVTIDLRAPETVGATAQGIRRNFFILGGSCIGDKLNATIKAGGGDWLLIQSDGVALPSVRTTWETPEGAVLHGDYYGVCDLGEMGYRNALEDRFPDTVDVQFAPRFVTAHPRYAWINRLQCLGIGQVDLVKLVVRYDLYAVRAGRRPSQERT